KKKGIEGGEGGSSNLKLDIYDPFYLHPQDIDSQLITFKLEGTENYKVWFADVQLALHTRNKIGSINGKSIRDENVGPLQEQWDRSNDVVLSWLLGCVSPDLYKRQILSKNAKNVWEELKETYNKQDGFVIYNLHHKIYTLTQSGMSLSEYYHECNSLWRQFDSLVDLPACTCEDSTKLREHAQLLRYPPGFKKSNGNQNSSNNVSAGDNKSDHNKSTTHTLTSDQYQILMSLLSDACNASTSHASVAVKQLRNIKHGNNPILKDVLVVPGYKDLTQKSLMGTGSDRGGL
ncbi:ribonuclease H-like domain-containing protein, partial [Tanacetum coccineum]